MKLIAGLGNPEPKYMKTRHNVGFMVMDEILKQKGLKLAEKFKSYYTKDNDIIYCMPATYMNLSGHAIREIISFYKINIKDVLIIYDDISLDLGTLRFRENGTDGGHNGIKSIIKETGSLDFPRLKIGIGPQPKGIKSENFVLQNFNRDERETLLKMVQTASNAALDWITKDMRELQNKYNKKH